MDAATFYAARNDRTMRYAGRFLDPSRSITISADPDYLATRDGQVAAIVLTNLLGRMSPNVGLAFPDLAICGSLPWSGESLHRFVLERLAAADPFGTFTVRERRPADYVIHLGRDGHDWVVHGSGWNAYVGPSPSPLPEQPGPSFGGALAATTAAAVVFIEKFPESVRAVRVGNALDWKSQPTSMTAIPSVRDVGNTWIIGTGSVGCSVLYFLTLERLEFTPTLIDKDTVKVENLDRSPIFDFCDIGKSKVNAVARFLDGVGVSSVTDSVSLAQSPIWRTRQQGVPDILVAAANEDDVRYLIETAYPPVQIYGTTGSNWQSAVLRHLPTSDACTCCIFPPAQPAVTKCATGTFPVRGPQQVDAALPFLSFAAGLMAAAEIAKLNMPGFPFSPNRSFFQPFSEQLFVSIEIQRRQGCICHNRRHDVHKDMIRGSRYATLRPTEASTGVVGRSR